MVTNEFDLVKDMERESSYWTIKNKIMKDSLMFCFVLLDKRRTVDK